MSKYPSKVMSNNNKICNICKKLTINNDNNVDSNAINIMNQINNYASMFSKKENEYNYNNKYNFGYLPYFIYKYIVNNNINNNNINNIVNLYIHKYNDLLTNEDSQTIEYNIKKLILIIVIVNKNHFKINIKLYYILLLISQKIDRININKYIININELNKIDNIDINTIIDINQYLVYIITSIYIYQTHFDYPKLLANENYDEYNGRQYEFLLSNVYSDLTDNLLINTFKSNELNDDTIKKINDKINPNFFIFNYQNGYLYNNTYDITYYGNIAKINIILFCKYFRHLINVYKDTDTDYNILLTEIYYKLIIDTKYIFVILNNDDNNLINLFNLYKNLNDLQQINNNINDIIKTSIFIIQNYCFIFKPLNKLITYSDIYNKNVNNKAGGDLYSIINNQFFIIDSKFYKNPNDCLHCRTFTQAYLYMNAYYNPLCSINNSHINKFTNLFKSLYHKNDDILKNNNDKLLKDNNNLFFFNSLYTNYYLVYINPYTADLQYIDYISFYKQIYNKKILTGYKFNTGLKFIKDKNGNYKSENDIENEELDKKILKFNNNNTDITYHFIKMYIKSEEQNNQDIININIDKKFQDNVPCNNILKDPDIYRIKYDDKNLTDYRKLLCICAISEGKQIDYSKINLKNNDVYLFDPFTNFNTQVNKNLQYTVTSNNKTINYGKYKRTSLKNNNGKDVSCAQIKNTYENSINNPIDDNSNIFNFEQNFIDILNNSNQYYIYDEEDIPNQSCYKTLIGLYNDYIQKYKIKINNDNKMEVENDNNENLSKYKQILDDYTISNRSQQFKKERALYACCKLNNQHAKCENNQINCDKKTKLNIIKSINLINNYNVNNKDKKRKANAIKTCQYMMYKDNELYNNTCKQKGIHASGQNIRFADKILKQNTK